MDALGDYVWPRATSELILLPVTGLECVGDRLLAGEAWLQARKRSKKLRARLGGATGTKGCPEEDWWPDEAGWKMGLETRRWRE